MRSGYRSRDAYGSRVRAVSVQARRYCCSNRNCKYLRLSHGAQLCPTFVQEKSGESGQGSDSKMSLDDHELGDF